MVLVNPSRTRSSTIAWWMVLLSRLWYQSEFLGPRRYLKSQAETGMARSVETTHVSGPRLLLGRDGSRFAAMVFMWRGVVVMGGGQSVRRSVSRVVVVGGGTPKKG